MQIEKLSNRLHQFRSSQIKIKVEENGDFITIPTNAIALLIDILSNMSEGKSITVIPSNSVLTTQQAAEILNVSRPHVVKLLEQKIIPFKKVGSHRRVLLKDILKYQDQQKILQEENLRFHTEQAQKLDLDYE
ncbi:MAG: helix-turn-helix domain-containing protein [Bacteroidetes bacterium]|nr:helix-turn-helix domain-containing protein [Bacteroidota bacterium]